jgi:hypothetical protein
MAEFINIDGEVTPIAEEKVNPKKITDATRFALIESAGLYGGYITGLTFSAKEGGVYNGPKLLEKAEGQKYVTLPVSGVSDSAGSGEVFFIDFEGVVPVKDQPKYGVVEKWKMGERGRDYKSGVVYTANSDPNKGGKGSGFQFTLITDRKGGVDNISNVISYGEGYTPGEFIPITGGPGSGAFIYIESVVDTIPKEIGIDIETGEKELIGKILYKTYAIQKIYTTPDADIIYDEEQSKYRNYYQVGTKIVIDPSQWGEETSQLPVTFERKDYENTEDLVSEGVSLARSNNGGGLYNSISEVEYNQNDYSSPANTEWNSYYIDSEPGMYGFSDLSNVSSRKYGTFYTALWESVGKHILNTDLVMHDKTTGLYWMFEFHNWTQGGKGGGFAYTRTLITNTKYAETTFTKTDYGSEVDSFSQYLSLKRGNNKGIYNPIELPKGYESLGGASHLWMSEPMNEYKTTATLDITFDLNLTSRDLDDKLDILYLQIRGQRFAYPDEKLGITGGLLVNTGDYTVIDNGEINGFYRVLTITVKRLEFYIPNYSTWELEGLSDKQQEEILKQTLQNEIFFQPHLSGLDRETASPEQSSIRLVDIRNESQFFLSLNHFSQEFGFFYSNVNIEFKLPNYYKRNLYITFNPDEIDIEYLKENITLEKINSMPWDGWGGYQMVPWEIVHGANPPEMLDKEMIMLDVQDGRFYRIKFINWTQGAEGGGFSYIKSDISISQNIVATVTDIAYTLVNSFTEPLKNQFSLQILFDKYSKQHFVRITEEDGTIIDHDFDGKDFVPTELPEDNSFTGYTIEDTESGVSKLIFEWSNNISSTDKLGVNVDSNGAFTIQDTYVENGKLVVEISNDKTFYWFFGGSPDVEFRVNGGPSNQINGLQYILFNRAAYIDTDQSDKVDIYKSLPDVGKGWRIDMVNLTSPGNYATYEILSEGVGFSENFKYYYIRPISGQGFFDLQSNHFWSMRFYPSGSITSIPYFQEFNFDIIAYDKLGNRIQDTLSVYNKKEDDGGKITNGIDTFTGYYKVYELTRPYFTDESYHAVIYTAKDLDNWYTNEGEYFPFRKGNVITEIGFPFTLGKSEGGDVLTDEDVEGGFKLAAKIYTTKLSELETGFVKDNWIIDDEFNPKILDKQTAKTGEVRYAKDEEIRYVYFPIDSFVWDGQSNILIIYYMDGSQTEKGGWNGAFKEVSYTESEELLNFSKDNNWEGERSPAVEFRYKAKVNLSFTTNDTRGKK